ncbi:MAG: integrase core domain-containing protein [Brumimicrobium sp.]|nr:integrase core domain-containing protein [Brumimicrobium sp.]
MKRKKYDSFLIWLYNQNKEYLIPENIRKNIPYSTISTWRNLDYSCYVGHQISAIQKEAIEQFEVFQEYQKLKFIVLNIIRVWKKTSNYFLPIIKENKKMRSLMIDSMQLLFTAIPKKIVLDIYKISPTTFYAWLTSEKVNCGISPLSLCFKRHPFQLAKKEVETIKNLFRNPSFICLPASSIYYYALRNNMLSISLSTFYKYANLLGLKRKFKKIDIENYHPLKTSKPNEVIHIDTTFWELTIGIKAAIILICDNFSKMIIGWNIDLRKNGENAKKALKKAWETIRYYHPHLKRTTLITDGGAENNNLIIQNFIEKSKMPELNKLLALKDVRFSNSTIEAVNKIIKRYLRVKRPTNLIELNQCLKDIIYDYNAVRPHTSLNGCTPLEVYTQQKINLDFSKQKANAKKIRIAQNKEINCCIDYEL